MIINVCGQVHITFIAVQFVNCYVVSLSTFFSFNNYVSLIYIPLCLGNRVATFFWKLLPTLLVICSFCGCLIVFVSLSLWCWGLLWI